MIMDKYLFVREFVVKTHPNNKFHQTTRNLVVHKNENFSKRSVMVG